MFIYPKLFTGIESVNVKKKNNTGNTIYVDYIGNSFSNKNCQRKIILFHALYKRILEHERIETSNSISTF